MGQYIFSSHMFHFPVAPTWSSSCWASRAGLALLSRAWKVAWSNAPKGDCSMNIHRNNRNTLTGRWHANQILQIRPSCGSTELSTDRLKSWTQLRLRPPLSEELLGSGALRLVLTIQGKNSTVTSTVSRPYPPWPWCPCPPPWWPPPWWPPPPPPRWPSTWMNNMAMNAARRSSDTSVHWLICILFWYRFAFSSKVFIQIETHVTHWSMYW